MNQVELIINEFTRTNDIKPHLSAIDEIGRIEFISELLFRQGIKAHYNVLPWAKELYIKFSLGDWKKLFIKCQAYDEALAGAISFLYKFVKVDCLNIINEIPEITQENKKAIHDFFQRWPGALAYNTSDQELVDRLELNFGELTKRLINEGAKPATPIEPQYIDISDLLE